MKTGTLIFLMLWFIPSHAKQIVIQRNADGGWYYKSNSPVIKRIQPGDTIIVGTDIPYGYLQGLNGTKEKPITILNKGKQVRFGTNGAYGLILEDCHYFIIDGTGDPKSKYGFVFGREKGDYAPQTLSLGMSDNYEIKNVEIARGEVGMFSNYNSGGNLHNIKIHDNWIHNMRGLGVTSEGMYFGNTSTASVKDVHFDSIEVYNNLFEDLGGDGLQLCNAQNYKVYNNTIRNFGIQKFVYQQSGLIIGGNSWGQILNNTIENGTGSGIQLFGCGYNLIKGNKIINTSTSERQDAIYISKRGLDGPVCRTDVINNTIAGANRNGIRNENEASFAKPGVWSGNKISGTKATKYSTKVDRIK
ncbi:MAG: right-handed parallel beta-helix repeat-containing protein [Sphingobacteriales bacterium]|nr:MAG: right-handed parallel beta-helix repeat-containing protein [Sphingobacteriales bacterium]